jgi:hypothetical protein
MALRASTASTALRIAKRSSLTFALFLNKSPRFLEAKGTAALVKERRNDAKQKEFCLTQ